MRSLSLGAEVLRTVHGGRDTDPPCSIVIASCFFAPVYLLRLFLNMEGVLAEMVLLCKASCARG